MAEVDLGIEDLEQFKVVGSGGFATVYAAWDVKFRRWVAVKVLHSLDDAGRRRFEREQGLMGQFDDHAHIVTPYRSGYTDTGAPYLVMEYLRGGSLQDRIDDDGPMSIAEAVGYVVPIARALGRAHSDGVVHRDVKPANILLTTDDVPKLTDFGIATIREATATQVAFTLAHSPPETFGSGVDARDERADLYSLASTLFTLVMGRAPFDVDHSNDSQLAYLRRIETDKIPATGHQGLDDVLVTAMAKAPEDRYRTASQFTAALTGALTPAEVEIAPLPTPIDDDPVAVDEPQDDDRDPPEPIHEHTTQLVPPPVTPPVPDAPAKTGPPRGWIWAGTASFATLLLIFGLLVIRGPNTIATYTGHTKAVFSVVQLGNGLIASAGQDDMVQIWDPTNPDTTIDTYTGHTNNVNSVVQLDNGLIASASSDRTVQIWDPSDPNTIIAIYTGHTRIVNSVVQLDNGLIASASVDNTVQIWDPNSTAFIATYTGHTASVHWVVQLDNGLIASASGDQTVQIWDPTDPDTTIDTYTGHTSDVRSVSQLNNGLIASASADNMVQIWDPNNPDTTIDTYTGHTNNVNSVVQLDNGLIASTGSDDTVQIWDPTDPDTTIDTYTGHTSSVYSVVELDNGLIASPSFDATVQIWDPNKP